MGTARDLRCKVLASGLGTGEFQETVGPKRLLDHITPIVHPVKVTPNIIDSFEYTYFTLGLGTF